MLGHPEGGGGDASMRNDKTPEVGRFATRATAAAGDTCTA